MRFVAIAGRRGRRSLIVVKINHHVAGVVQWLEKVAADLGKESLVLNVAGPRESKCVGIQQSTRAFVKKLIGVL